MIQYLTAFETGTLVHWVHYGVSHICLLWNSIHLCLSFGMELVNGLIHSTYICLTKLVTFLHDSFSLHTQPFLKSILSLYIIFGSFVVPSLWYLLSARMSCTHRSIHQHEKWWCVPLKRWFSETDALMPGQRFSLALEVRYSMYVWKRMRKLTNENENELT